VLQTAAAGQARFDHNPVTGESLGLLIEEQRSNLVTYSADFSNAYWVKSNAAIESNVAVAPDGTLTADKLTTSASNAWHVVYSGASTLSGAHTFSGYVKAAGYSKIAIGDAQQPAGYAVFDSSNGTLVSQASTTATSITSVGNGWYRITCTITLSASTRFSFTVIDPSYTSGSFTTAWNATDTFSGIYIWGAQLEAGAFPTSYIPTVAATVTRNNDIASMTGTNFTSWFSNAEGTLYGEGGGRTSQGALATINPAAEDFNNMIVLGALPTASAFRVWRSGSSQADFGTISAGVQNKLSLGYAVNNIAGSINGATVITDTSCLIPNLTTSTFSIGRGWSGTHFLNGTIKKLAYYPARLSDAQLQALTTN
jgi:hypothetical protein